jgi:hypothetical protein
MKSFNLCLSALVLSLKVTAVPTPDEEGTFRLPQNSKDGLYLHVVDSDGVAGLEYLGLFNSTSEQFSFTNITSESLDLTEPGALSRRKPQGSYCQGNYIDPTSWDGAIDGLLGICKWSNHFSKAIAYQSGNAIAYGCNYGNGQECYYDSVNSFFTWLKSDCGNNQQGYYSYPKWKVSYGVVGVGNSYCY